MRVLRLAQTVIGVGRRRLRRRWRRFHNGAGVDPDFVVIGVQKSGTTALFDALVRSPQVREAAAKEVAFFTKSYHRGRAWYRSHFPPPDQAPGSITGEATPGYFTDPRVPARLAETLPDARLVVLFRDPAERAYSQYRMAHRAGFEDAPSFGAALEARVEGVGAAEAALAEDPAGASQYLNRFGYLHHSRYQDHLRRWLDHVDARSLLVVFREDLLGETAKVLAGVCEHLGVAPPASEALPPPEITPPGAEVQRQGLEEVRRDLIPQVRALRELIRTRGVPTLELGNATWFEA